MPPKGPFCMGYTWDIMQYIYIIYIQNIPDIYINIWDIVKAPGTNIALPLWPPLLFNTFFRVQCVFEYSNHQKSYVKTSASFAEPYTKITRIEILP
jgi:hypothetical protein